MNLDWARLRAVVLESDDWGLCAWVPDREAWTALAETPAFRSPAGRRYGGSTLESAADVKALAGLLLEYRGGDGATPVWQANTVMANPDYTRLGSLLHSAAVHDQPRRATPPRAVPPHGRGSLAATDDDSCSLPLVELPEFPSRWARPGLWDEVARAREAGVWRIELHGLHHLPASAWLAALRRGDADARLALAHGSPVCAAVEAGGEYDPSEPREVRGRSIERAVARFRSFVGRAPGSFCPPDYRWDESLEADAERHGVTTFQGKAEQAGEPLLRLRRAVLRRRFPHTRGQRFYMPPRIAFEPCGRGAAGGSAAVETTLKAARAAWKRSQPAIVSSHRLNYAHLDPEWPHAGREALRALLGGLCHEGATFVTDAGVRSLAEHGVRADERSRT